VSAHPAIALIGSPLLGPSVWVPVRDRFRALGWDASILSTTQAQTGDPQLILAELLADVADDSVLVGHSNAGAYLPPLAVASDANALIFVDAILPPSVGATSLTKSEFIESLASLAVDGVLPPWTKWWPDDAVDSLFPDVGTRELIEAEQPRLPLEYFRQSIDAPPGWDDRPTVYLAFGETYAAERLDAEGRGWPTQVLAGDHLHMLVNPAQVAAALLNLAENLVDSP
jgi:hypothetical protein